MKRRATAALAGALALAGLGIAVTAVALADAGGATVVTVGASSAISPATATPEPGGKLQFVNGGTVPFVITRSANPLALSMSVDPMSSSTPITVPEAAGGYGYTAQAHETVLLAPDSTGPPQDGLILVTPSPTASDSPSATDPATGSPTASDPAATSPAAAPPPPSAGPDPRKTPTKAGPTLKNGKPSPTPSGTATPTFASLPPGVLLPAPEGLPSFGSGAPVPLPELPTAVASADGGQALPSLGSIASSAASPTVSPSPVAQIAADAPRQGPRRSRGLPIALAVVLLLGVGGAVVRAIASIGSRLQGPLVDSSGS